MYEWQVLHTGTAAELTPIVRDKWPQGTMGPVLKACLELDMRFDIMQCTSAGFVILCEAK